MGEGTDYAATQAWRLAVFFFVFCIVSVGAEHGLHKLDHHFVHMKRFGLQMTLVKFKEELMLLGLISMLLTIFQSKILAICVPASWDHHAEEEEGEDAGSYVSGHDRRFLAGAPEECAEDMAPFISVAALHQVHIFIFLMGTAHILMGATSMILALKLLHTWTHWEEYIGSFNAALGDPVSAETETTISRKMSISPLAAKSGGMTREQW